jgi:hypothetical protein
MGFRKLLLPFFALEILVCASFSANAHRVALNAETSNEDQSLGVLGETSVPSQSGGHWGFSGFFNRSQDRSNSSLRTSAAGFDIDHEWGSGWQFGGGFESARSEPNSSKSSNFKVLLGYAFYHESADASGAIDRDKFLQIQLRPQSVRYDFPSTTGGSDESYLARGSELALSWFFAEDWKLYVSGSKFTIMDRNAGVSGGLLRRAATQGSASTVLAIESESTLGLNWWINDFFDLEVSSSQSKSDQSGEVIREGILKLGAQAEVLDFALGIGNSKSDTENIHFTNFEVGWNF